VFAPNEVTKHFTKRARERCACPTRQPGSLQLSASYQWSSKLKATALIFKAHFPHTAPQNPTSPVAQAAIAVGIKVYCVPTDTPTSVAEHAVPNRVKGNPTDYHQAGMLTPHTCAPAPQVLCADVPCAAMSSAYKSRLPLLWSSTLLLWLCARLARLMLSPLPLPLLLL